MPQASKGWHPEDIKAALRKKYGSLSALSESWGLHGTAIANTLRRPLNSMRVEKRIAEALGIPLHEIWPARWDAKGNPKPRSRADVLKRRPSEFERQIDKAA